LPKIISNCPHEKLINFIDILSDINPFFKKVNSLVLICLLKIGKIKTYNSKEIIQK
jgi:hypothetical protein